MPRNPEKRVSSLACVECRSHHLKCDSTEPTCSRCIDHGLHCRYVPSKRGGRRKKRSSLMETSESTSAERSSPIRVQAWDVALATASNEVNPSQLNYARLYYEQFHPGHPILIPNINHFTSNYPHFLRSVVYYVGSLFTGSSSTPTWQLKQDATISLRSNSDVVGSSPQTVQAWLLLAIASFSQGELDEAKLYIQRGSKAALELGMNRLGSSPSLVQTEMEAESIRRTWWELYITEIQLSAHISNVDPKCSRVTADTPLPCEEDAFIRGSIPQPHGVIDFKRRVFQSNLESFSSFSYRVEAAAILHQVLVINHLRDQHSDQIQAVDNAIVSWSNHLPQDKQQPMNGYGRVDKMIFQAHIIIAYAASLLHYPRSNLELPAREIASYFANSVPTVAFLSTKQSIHKVKAVEASRTTSDLISMCPTVAAQTPLLMPMYSLCAYLQLVAYRAHSEDCFDHHYNRVVLVLGSLRSLGRVWAAAISEGDTIRTIAASMMGESVDRCAREPPSQSVQGDVSSRAEVGQASSPRQQQDTYPSMFFAYGCDPLLTDSMLSLCYSPSALNPPLLGPGFI